MAFLSVPICFREQHHTDSGTPLFWLRLYRAVVKVLTAVCRVRRRQMISHGFPAEAPTDVRQAREAEPVDAPLAPAAEPVDGLQAPAEAYKYCAQSAVAEPA
jgi:hypothetical protein